MSFLPSRYPKQLTLISFGREKKKRVVQFCFQRGRLTVAGRSGQRLSTPCLTIRFAVVVFIYIFIFFVYCYCFLNYKGARYKKKKLISLLCSDLGCVMNCSGRMNFMAGIAKVRICRRRKTMARDCIFSALHHLSCLMKSGDGRRWRSNGAL